MPYVPTGRPSGRPRSGRVSLRACLWVTPKEAALLEAAASEHDSLGHWLRELALGQIPATLRGPPTEEGAPPPAKHPESK